MEKEAESAYAAVLLTVSSEGMASMSVGNASERLQWSSDSKNLGDIVDPLVNALNTILIHEDRHRKECIICPASNLVGRVLRLIQSKGYVGEIEFIDDGRQGKFRVQLFGRINNCKAVRPRYSANVKALGKI
jgi:hypothetical protein